MSIFRLSCQFGHWFPTHQGGSLQNREHQDAGFTLVEVLISMFVFSILSVATFSSLGASLRAKVILQEKNQDIAQFQTMITLIRSDMAAVVLRPMRDQSGERQQFMFRGGLVGPLDHKSRKTLLEFTRSGRANPGGLEKRGDLQRIVYSIQNDQLLRSSLTNVNPDFQTQEFDRVLMRNVAALDIKFIAANRTYADQISGDMVLNHTVSNWSVLSRNTDLRSGAGLPHIVVFDLVLKNGHHTTHYVEVGL